MSHVCYKERLSIKVDYPKEEQDKSSPIEPITDLILLSSGSISLNFLLVLSISHLTKLSTCPSGIRHALKNRRKAFSCRTIVSKLSQ